MAIKEIVQANKMLRGGKNSYHAINHGLKYFKNYARDLKKGVDFLYKQKYDKREEGNTIADCIYYDEEPRVIYIPLRDIKSIDKNQKWETWCLQDGVEEDDDLYANFVTLFDSIYILEYLKKLIISGDWEDGEGVKLSADYLNLVNIINECCQDILKEIS